MTTIGSPVYCGNSNYPLWLANGAPISSPTTVIDNQTKGFTTTVTESNTTTAYNDFPATTQAYAGIVFSKSGGTGSNSGLFLQTNGQTNFAINGGGNAVQTFAPLQVTNAESNYIQVSSEAIAFNGLASNALTIADGGLFSIGQSVDVSPQLISVYNSSTNQEADLNPTGLLIGTYANTTASITQDFSGQSLSGPSYAAIRPTFAGITWTTSGGTPGDCGITKVNPALSSKAVTTSGAYPGANAQAAYLGNFYVAYPQPIGTYNGFILPTLSVAQPGEPVTLSYAYAGGQSGRIIVNGIIAQSIPSSAVWVTASTTFVSTGNDEVEFQTQTVAYTGNASQFNITNITFTYTVASVSTPQASVYSTGRNASTYGVLDLVSLATNGTSIGSYIQIGDGFNGISQIAVGGASSFVNSNIALTTTAGGSAITITSPSVNLTTPSVALTSNAAISFTTSPSQMTINGGNNTYMNYQLGGANVQLTGDSIYMSGASLNINSTPVSFNSSSLSMGGGVITNVSNIDSGGILTIGQGTPSNFVFLNNVGGISGTLTSGGGTGFTISNVNKVNQSPACPNGILWYYANFGAFRLISTGIVPAISVRMNAAYPPGLVPDNFNGSAYVTIPAYCYLTLTGAASFTQSNTTSVPGVYACSVFDPNNSGIRYTLAPILV